MKIFHLFGSLMMNPVIVDTVDYMLNLLFFFLSGKKLSSSCARAFRVNC